MLRGLGMIKWRLDAAGGGDFFEHGRGVVLFGEEFVCISHGGNDLAKKTAFVGTAGDSWEFVGIMDRGSVLSLLDTIDGSSPLESM